MKKTLKKMMCLGMAAMMMTASFTACGSKKDTGSDKNDSTKTFKIGSIGPITGKAATYGNAVKNGAQIAVDEINASGGINGYKIDYKFEDDEAKGENAVTAYGKLKDWGMQMLMGTVTSDACTAVAEKTDIDEMYQLTPSGSAVECVAKDNAFQVCFSDPNQGTASAQYIGENKLAEKVAAIYDSSSVYSSGIYNKFKSESANQNFTIVSEGAFTEDTNRDFKAQLTAAKEAGATLIFLPIYYQEASLILQQAKDINYDVTFFGCDGLDGILTVENFDKSLAEGVLLLTPFAADATDAKTKSFVEKYQEKYKEIPNQFAADAYDAIYIMKAAAEKANATPDMSVSELCNKMKEAMPQIKVDGLTGTGMVWAATGEVNKAPKAVQIKDGSYVSYTK